MLQQCWQMAEGLDSLRHSPTWSESDQSNSDQSKDTGSSLVSVTEVSLQRLTFQAFHEQLETYRCTLSLSQTIVKPLPIGTVVANQCIIPVIKQL